MCSRTCCCAAVACASQLGCLRPSPAMIRASLVKSIFAFIHIEEFCSTIDRARLAEVEICLYYQPKKLFYDRPCVAGNVKAPGRQTAASLKACRAGQATALL